MIARILPEQERGRLTAETGVPQVFAFVPPRDVQVVVVEDGGEIVGTVAVLRMTHLEGLWVSPERRGNPGLVRHLLRTALEAAKPAEWIVAGVPGDEMRGILRRLGAHPMSAEMFLLKR
jgi:hypothetical protein